MDRERKGVSRTPDGGRPRGQGALRWTARDWGGKSGRMADPRGRRATGDDMAKPPGDGATGQGAGRPAQSGPSGRDVRLKAALKANLARRKAQGRALAPGAERGAWATALDVARNPAEPDAATSHSTPDTSDAPAPDLEKD